MTLKCVPGVQGVDEAMSISPHYLTFALDKAVRRRPWKHFSDGLKDEEVYEWIVYENPRMLEYVPDHFKAREMCYDMVIEDPLLLRYVPDWFVTQQLIELWNDYCHDDRLIKWPDSYKKRKAQEGKIKEEVLPIVWNPDRVMDWCMSEYKRRHWK